jgi:hypothetical protein
LLIAIGLAACACTKATPTDDGEPRRATGAPQPSAIPEVHLTGADGVEHVVEVEVVRTEAELERGLMFRRHLDPDAGMLFLMGETKVHTFWMSNTYIPLDMIFITKELTVAGVAADAVPHDETLRSVETPSLYVLEVNAGWAKKRGVGAGAKVEFVRVKGAPSTP